MKKKIILTAIGVIVLLGVLAAGMALVRSNQDAMRILALLLKANIIGRGATSIPTPQGTPCTTDADCTGGAHCGKNGVCILQTYPSGCDKCSNSLDNLVSQNTDKPPLSTNLCGEGPCYSDEATNIYSCSPKGCASNKYLCQNVDTYCNPARGANIGSIGIAGPNVPWKAGIVPVLSWEEKKIGPFNPLTFVPMQSRYLTPETKQCTIMAIKGSKWMKTGDLEPNGEAKREGVYIMAHTNEEIQKSASGQWIRFGLINPSYYDTEGESIVPSNLSPANLKKTGGGTQGVVYRILVNGKVVCPEAYGGGDQYVRTYNFELLRKGIYYVYVPRVRCNGNRGVRMTNNSRLIVFDYKIPKKTDRLTVTVEATYAPASGSKLNLTSGNIWYDQSEYCKPLIIDVGKGYGETS